MPTVLVVLTVLAIARLGRLVSQDRAFKWLREARFVKRRPTLEYLFSCPWCVSVYLGAALSAGVWWLLDLPWERETAAWLILLTLVGSFLSGILVTIELWVDEVTALARRTKSR